ncbi:hypothetical protein XOC_3729 [Xanthomonas oryzae pv. oryzicola BLS256]|uniref:Uncharacterized protein n=1 Tax=Xanthomonas oryzae pv. oryzicola (strain BLS256) TaxID=383407 RepID=G7TFS0_XANOB|nr:hypothetical protein XOC_3729 [Xanthomonas oryzae pv. oryzicola BLS256]QEO96005.1 hypothetical protein XOCgx_1011 [Xanthomonas oryzae pv. oryzicola]
MHSHQAGAANARWGIYYLHISASVGRPHLPDDCLLGFFEPIFIAMS